MYACSASYPFIIDMTPKKEVVEEPMARPRREESKVEESRRVSHEAGAKPRWQSSRLESSEEKLDPYPLVPEMDSDDPDEEDMMDLWASRHKMPGGMMEALEKINQMLEAPSLEVDNDDDDTPGLASRIDALCDANDPATSHSMAKLIAGLGACADAQSQLKGAAIKSPRSPVGSLLSNLEEKVRTRAKALFRVVDPHEKGSCEGAHFEALMESCGLSGSERDAVFAALGDSDGDAPVVEATFVHVITPHIRS